jgi:hypothetical protein
VFRRYEQFIRERRYLMNVSPATVRWYSHAQKWLAAKTRPQWSPQNRPTVVRAKPANGRGRGLSCSTCSLLWRQVYFRAPTPRTAFENMTIMEEAIEHGGDGGAISQQFAPVVDGSVRGEQSTGAGISSRSHPSRFCLSSTLATTPTLSI